MDEFLHALTSWGVAPFSTLLIAAVLYWLLVILGALDIDLLHLHIGHHGDAAGGHGDGHGSDPHHGGPLAGFLEFLSIGKVPLTVILSLLVFIGWSVAMLLALLWLPWPLVLGGSIAAAIPATAAACRPLRLVFGALDAGVQTGVSLLGREARITSATCDAAFGTATCDVGDAEVLLRVVASRPELAFRRDDVVVIADHDAERDVYLVGPAGYRAPVIEAERPMPPVEPLAAAEPPIERPQSTQSTRPTLPQ